MVYGLDSNLIERCPDLLVVLDADRKVVRASAGLRALVALVEPGMDFAKSLDGPSQARLEQALGLARDATTSFGIELVHRGRERLVAATYRFYELERPYVAGIGRESAPAEGWASVVWEGMTAPMTWMA